MNWTEQQLRDYEARRGLQSAIPQPPVRNDPVAAPPRTEPCPPSTPQRPVLTFTLYRRRLLDRTNAYGGCKYLEDAIVLAGLLPGDSEAEVETIVRQSKVKTPAEERTEILITYP